MTPTLEQQTIIESRAQGLIDGYLQSRVENADLWHFRPDFKPLPTTTHGALLAKCRAALADLHIQTRIVYMEPAAYHQCLDKRADSETTRSEWAAFQ